MKRSKAILVCLLTLAALSCVYGAKRYPMLNSTQDLRNIYAEKNIPEHSLPLLHLLANKVNIDNNNNVYPDFDPTKDYGSHEYRNNERLLDPPPNGCSYRTIGNFYFNNRPDTCSNSKKVPPYVCNPKGQKTPNKNRARILLCVNYSNYMWRIRQAYLTQHFERNMYDPPNSAYDPDRTFEISPKLLKELQEFSLNDDVEALKSLRDRHNQNIGNWQLDEIIRRWGRRQAPLGLLMLMIIYFKRMNRSYGTAPDISEWQTCELHQIDIDVVTGNNGYATVVWKDIPQSYVKEGATLLVINHQEVKTYIPLTTSTGSYETWESLEEGLLVSLHKFEDHWFSFTVIDEICRSKEFQSPNAVPVKNYNFAKLQIFVRNGYSCFRLYIDDCDEWQTKFHNSWVGLYESDGMSAGSYEKWQWVTSFAQGPDSDEYKTFEYCTNAVVAPGHQARFMFKDYEEYARTPAWPQSEGYSPHSHREELLA